MEANKQQTKKLSLTLSEEVIRELKRRARKLYGKRKGGMSFFAEMVLRNEFHLGQKDVEEQ
jgi:hypothetical protein